MNRKVLIPLALLLVVGLAAMLFFIFSGDDPAPDAPHEGTPGVAKKQDPDRKTTPVRTPTPVPENIQPDPVAVKPRETFVFQKDLPRIIATGRVVDGNGIGIPDAEVVFSGDRSMRGVYGMGYTDGGGSYSILAWASTRARRTPSQDRAAVVAARAPDGGAGVARSEALPEEDRITMPDVVIAAGGSIEGTIETSDRMPAAGAPVTVQSAGRVPMADMRGREPRIEDRIFIRKVQADERGAFKLTNLAAGKYRITGDAGYLGMNTSAEIIEVAEGRITSATIVLRAENYIRGQVLDAVGQPVPGAVVQLSSNDDAATSPLGTPVRPNTVELRRAVSDGSGPLRFDEAGAGNTATQMTDTDGRFGFFTLQDREWTVAARVGKAETRLEGVRVNQADLALRLSSGGGRLVSGTVVNAETGLAITAFDLRVQKSDRNDPDALTLVAEDGAFPWRPGGAFRVVNAPEGDFSVRVSAPGYVPLSMPVSALGQGEHRSGLHGELVPLCDLHLTPTHEGRRYDLEPVVLLYGERQVAYKAATDALGHVRIRDVAPGDYTFKLMLQDGTTLTAEITVPRKKRADVPLDLSVDAPG
jgi:protocatechuate 3,4-dioxygenase beta subunit